jgi:periplasmic protein TonB
MIFKSAAARRFSLVLATLIAIAFKVEVGSNSTVEQGALLHWRAALVAHLQSHVDYPKLAQTLGSEGRALLSFVVDRKGELHNVRVVNSSGSMLLDGASLRMLYQAQPVPPPPLELAGDRFPIIVPLRYRLLHEQN